MVIKTKKWNKKKREETKKPLIIVVDNYLREVDVNKCYDNIYRTGWLNFCYMNKKFILKQDMSTEEKKKYVNDLYFGNLLPNLDQNYTKKVIKKNTKPSSVLKKINMMKFVE